MAARARRGMGKGLITVMLVLRMFGRGLMLLGLAVLVVGLVSWLGGGDVTRPAGFVLAEWNRPLLNASQAFIERYLYAPVWEGAVVPLLLRPWWEAVTILFLVLVLAGGALAWLGRQRERKRRRRGGLSG